MLKGKMKGLLSILFAVAFLSLAGASQAQYMGPGDMKADVTVAQILKKPIDGQQVLLKGNITKKYGKKHYEFKDSTGTIRIEAKDKLFYNQKITEKTVVEIFGEVDKDFMETPEVEVFRITIITP